MKKIKKFVMQERFIFMILNSILHIFLNTLQTPIAEDHLQCIKKERIFFHALARSPTTGWNEYM